MLVCVRGQYAQPKIRLRGGESKRPQDAQGVGFLARGAAGAPGNHAQPARPDGARGKLREHITGEKGEHAPVTVEAGNGDSQQRVCHGPLRWARFQVTSVFGGGRQVKLTRAPR